MIYFIEGFAKIQNYQNLFAFPKLTAFQGLLQVEWVGSRMSLKFIKDIMLVQVFRDVRSNYTLHNFT